MKSSLNHRIPGIAASVAEGALVSMVVGLFASRALLSVGIFLFFISAPFRLGAREWLRRSAADPLVWAFGMLWFLPVVSGLWSADGSVWLDVVRIKLPLLLLPMGWVGLSFSDRSHRRLGWILTALVFAGVVYSLIAGGAGSTAVVQDYLRGKTLVTPLENDRVRFSWLVVGVCWWLQANWRGVSGKERWLIAGLLLFFGIYLHVLAVRLGLLCFYLLTGFLLIRSFAVPTNRRWSIPGMILLLALPFILYQVLPTFRSRVDYIRYDWSYTLQGKYLPGGNDAIRMQSLQAAGELIHTSPVYGVGFGDIRSSMDSVYMRMNPSLTLRERIYPANAWAVYGVGMGWIGLIALSGCMVLLFVASAADAFRWRAWVLVTVLSLVTDIGLEVQFGVFLIPFLLLFFRAPGPGIKNLEIRA